MTHVHEIYRENINIMNQLKGFDTTIVCCSGIKQADYWLERLNKGKGIVVPKDSIVITVDEDWPGGAGNG
jgi:hypothetical protein